MSIKKTILFHRDFKGFTGGHLKVWDYYQHVLISDDFKPEIFFTPESVWLNNPWSSVKEQCLTKWDPNNADILFLAGMDWLALTEEQRLTPPKPVINFIHHVRHADKKQTLYEFLKYPALRICVSQEVSDAIRNTNIVNGKILTNTNGIDFKNLPSRINKDISILIIGLKNPEFAKKLSKNLSDIGINNHVLLKQLNRKDYLTLVNRAEIAVFLPNITEGFYLPALEAMSLKTLVVCPDCIGNRSFCINNVTSIVPKTYSINEIIEAIKYARLLEANKKNKIIDKAFATAEKHCIDKERDRFLKILTEHWEANKTKNTMTN